MRTIAILIAAACGARPAAPVHQDPPTPEADWRADRITPTCVASLRALVDGRLAEYHALDGCTRRDVEEAFGPSEPVGGELGAGRRSPAVRLDAYYTGTRLKAVLVVPTWTAKLLEVLGPPEEEGDSAYAPLERYRIWARRGLLAHFAPDTLRIRVVAASPSHTLEQLHASPVYGLGGAERLLQDSERSP